MYDFCKSTHLIFSQSFQMSSDARSKTSSPMSHFPHEQRDSTKFQRELTEISSSVRHPISLSTITSEEASVNITRIESTRCSDNFYQLFLDP